MNFNISTDFYIAKCNTILWLTLDRLWLHLGLAHIVRALRYNIAGPESKVDQMSTPLYVTLELSEQYFLAGWSSSTGPKSANSYCDAAAKSSESKSKSLEKGRKVFFFEFPATLIKKIWTHTSVWPPCYCS